MVRIKKTVALIVVAIYLLVGAALTNLPNSPAVAHAENSINAMIFEWRYKVIDGVVWRRLYNCSTSQWAGEWEVCP